MSVALKARWIHTKIGIRMMLKPIAVAAVLSLSAVAASAASYDLGALDSTGFDSTAGISGKFKLGVAIADSWSFTLDTASYVAFGAQQSFAVGSGIVNPVGVLDGYGPLTLSINPTLTQANLSWTGKLTAGTYTVHLSGISGANNTSYVTTVAAIPVPEPESYALLMAGLGVLGFVARRRQAI